MSQSETVAGKRARPNRTRQISSGQGFFAPSNSEDGGDIARPSLSHPMATIGEESFSASQSEGDDKVSRYDNQISTIGEAFYNSIGGSYMSDDDDDSEHAGDCSDTSSDTDVPYLSPQASTPPSSNHNTPDKDQLLLSERSSESKGSGGKRDVSNGEDTLLLSERTNASKGFRDTSVGEDTLMISDRSDLLARSENSGLDTLTRSGKRDVSQGDDTLMLSDRMDALIVSERSGASKNLRDNSNSTGDLLMRSAHSGVNLRDHSTGYDSLLVSETTDESWRRITKFAEGDDNSSISSTPSTPFPNLEEILDESKPESERMVAAIETPPLAVVDEKDDADPSTSNRNKTPEDAGDSRVKDRPLVIINANGIENNIEEGTLPPNTDGNSDYNGSISTNNSLRNTEERARRIPRRWIIDRIDGTVRPEEEEEGLPKWKRKPPLFLCLPSPLLGIFPWLFEENLCCVAVGKFGFFGVDTTTDENKTTAQSGDLEQSTNDETVTNKLKSTGFLRSLVIGHAIMFNACGLFATILAGLALTRSHPGMLQAAPFGKTTVIPTFETEDADPEAAVTGDAVTLYLGLLALGIDNPAGNLGGMVVVGFREFCDTPGTEQFLYPDECEACADVSLWIVVGYFLTVIAYLPTFSIGISRLYKNYDANCSKISAGIWALVSVLGYIIVLSCYKSCLGSLYSGEVLYTDEGAIQKDDVEDRDPGEAFLVAEFAWKAGVGQILFLIGLMLKIFDFASNCCIATPPITRSRELQWEYERASRRARQEVGDENNESGNPQEGSSIVNQTAQTDDTENNLSSDKNVMDQEGTQEDVIL